jgi:hypothetical protein
MITSNGNFKYLFLTLSLLFFSCHKENAFDCFKSTGKNTVEIRKPGFFRNIELNNKINVNIYQGSECLVEVIAGEHIIKKVSTKVIGDVLVIDDNNQCNMVRGYKREITINITLPYLVKATNASVAPIVFDQNFKQDTLIVRVTNSGDVEINGEFNQLRTSTHGNGDITITGKANSFYIYTNGTNFINAQNFLVKDYMFIETLSVGDCNVNATALNRLDYNIHDGGNIYYIGTPKEINDYSTQNHTGQAVQKN